MNENKDALFYSDLIYKIKQLAQFEGEEDPLVEARIEEREKEIPAMEDGIPLYQLSAFTSELFSIIIQIVKKANGGFTSPHEIAKYPELVQEAIDELQTKVDALTPVGTGMSYALPSGDSEVIADLLDGFVYDESKKDAVLEKYDTLLQESKNPVKKLTPNRNGNHLN